jgi:hydrogenase maturation protease
MRLASSEHAAPILVLGLGNKLMHDDGVGSCLLCDLAKRYHSESVEFLDGGTQGLALLSRFGCRKALVILDAVATGQEPGSVYVLEGADVIRFATSRSTTEREGNAGELLATAAFLGELPEKCYIIAVEPKDLEIGAGLSRDVHKSLKPALKKAQLVLDGLIEEFRHPVSA